MGSEDNGLLVSWNTIEGVDRDTLVDTIFAIRRKGLDLGVYLHTAEDFNRAGKRTDKLRKGIQKGLRGDGEIRLSYGEAAIMYHMLGRKEEEEEAMLEYAVTTVDEAKKAAQDAPKSE